MELMHTHHLLQQLHQEHLVITVAVAVATAVAEAEHMLIQHLEA
jgi:hypothetical protein